MVAFPAADNSVAPLPKTKKKPTIPMTSLFNKVAKAYSRTAAAAAPPPNPAAIFQYSEDDDNEEEEDDDDDDAEEQQRRQNPSTHSSLYHGPPTAYSLSSGPLSGHASQPSTASSSICFERSKQNPASSSTTSPASHHESSWQEQRAHSPASEAAAVSIHPSSHIKTLLLQFSSSISALKAAFAFMRASARAGQSIGAAEEAMAEELQRLSDLHTGMYSLVQELEFGMKQDNSEGTSSNEATEGGNQERHDMMLKSYEGIISRFHDEIRKKDAVTDALKETLAKSMLKGEKLERRVKALEAKLSVMQSR